MAEERVQRRLAAILAADVVGYSRLIEADEEGTRAHLTSLLTKILELQIATDGGRIVKTIGDGILVEYPSAQIDRTNCTEFASSIVPRSCQIPFCSFQQTPCRKTKSRGFPRLLAGRGERI